MADGAWWLHARAVDGAGNLGATTHYPIIVSYKTRVTMQITSPTHVEGQESDSNSPAFELSVSNPDGATVVSFQYVLDGQATTVPTISSASTTASHLEFAGLRNQSWWLHASARNDTGNLTDPRHYAFRVNFKGAIVEAAGVHAVPSPIRSRLANIRYDLRAPASEVTLEFMDAEGRLLSRGQGGTAPGVRTYVWDTHALANGVYFCRIKVKRQDGKVDTVTKKLGVVR